MAPYGAIRPLLRYSDAPPLPSAGQLRQVPPTETSAKSRLLFACQNHSQIILENVERAAEYEHHAKTIVRARTRVAGSY
jgi:hypothetical protein